METVVQFVLDKKPDKLIQQNKYVGRAINRVDGQLKVTGEAKFSAEYHLDNTCFAALAYSSVAKGKIKRLTLKLRERQKGSLPL